MNPRLLSSPGGLTVDELLQAPALQLRLLAGGDGVGRKVSWAHVSDLEDPTPWLLGAELIMTTGLAVPRRAAEQRAYLERLDDAGVAALAVSSALHAPPLSRAMLAAADERGFPLVEVPLSVPFIAITQEAAAALQSDLGQRLGAQLQVFGALRWLAAEDLDPAAVFARLEQLSGYDLYACTPQHRPLLPGIAVPPPAQLALLPDRADAPPTIPGGFVVPIASAGEPAAGHLVVLERERARPSGLAVVQHMATVAALQLTMLRHRQEILRREGAETLSELLHLEHSPAVVRRRLDRAGFGADATLALAAVRLEDEDGLETAVVRALAEHAGPHLVLRTAADLFVLFVDSAAPRRALESVPGLRAGVSRPFTANEPMAVARREATAAALAARATGRALVVYADDATSRWLPDDPVGLAALVEQVLGPALRYDEEHGSALVPSALRWLERDRATSAAAASLHVHVNTLAYRLRRFAELTGRDLGTTAGTTEVWLALRAARQLGHVL
jgi:purine catabolism regulator